MFDIVTLLNEATAPEHTSREYHALQERCSPYWDAVEKAFPSALSTICSAPSAP